MINLTVPMKAEEKDTLKGRRLEDVEEAVENATLALLLAKRGDTQTAAKYARAAIRFFDAQHVNHPDRHALDRLLLPRKPRIKEQ